VTLLDLQKAVLQDQGNEITKIKFNGSSREKGKKLLASSMKPNKKDLSLPLEETVE
jgi:hypothetical protein